MIRSAATHKISTNYLPNILNINQSLIHQQKTHSITNRLSTITEKVIQAGIPYKYAFIFACNFSLLLKLQENKLI